MKKFVSIMLFMSVFFTMFTAVGHAAEVVPKLYLNGLLLKSEVAPQIVNNSTIVPMRTISDGLGYQISWDNTAKTATVINGKDVIKLKLNDNKALVNDQSVLMDTPIMVVKGKTLVPLRFVGEQFGLNVEWKNTEKEVHMYEKPAVSIPEESSGTITDFSYDGANSVTIRYEGTVKTNKPMYLENPKRIVFDFPAANYSSSLSSLFLNGQVEVSVTDSTYLTGYRYSLYSKSPDIARVVFLIGDDTGYTLTENLGEFRLDFMSLSEVPGDGDTSVKPPVITDPVTPPANTGVLNVVIDPGHGGSDPGAKSILNRWEKEFTLSVGLKMKTLLEKELKIKVHLTRTGDTYPTLEERVQFANALKADLFLSIHANSAGATVSGTETYYYRDNSATLANIIHKHLISATKLKDRGVKTAAYKVIKDTTMPAVLIEAGFLTNTSDATMLYNDASQTKIATELVAGIKEFLKVN